MQAKGGCLGPAKAVLVLASRLATSLKHLRLQRSVQEAAECSLLLAK